jgi:hypothetical protein
MHVKCIRDISASPCSTPFSTTATRVSWGVTLISISSLIPVLLPIFESPVEKIDRINRIKDFGIQNPVLIL